MSCTPLDRLCVNTIKGLSMDAVQRANSGHPGMPMGMADASFVLWSGFLKHDPADPQWPDRDRFILSPGHGSMLIYSLLHLTGYDLSLDDILSFRQLHSRTPGHPEYGETAGVEITTGPLGQGLATGVGMAIAERLKRAHFGEDLCSHWIYGIVSDGDLMEGVAAEAASLAGHLGLGRLIYLYDDNEITIDGGTGITFTEDRQKRFEAYGWHTVAVDGHDHQQVADALRAAQQDPRPSLILCRTHIAHSAPTLQDTSKSHGSPLGAEEIRATKELLGMDPELDFARPEEVLRHMDAREAGASASAAWRQRLEDSGRREEWLAWHAAADPSQVSWPDFSEPNSLATRKASQAALEAASQAFPQLLGGSADLAGSNGTKISAADITADQPAGQRIHFGVREHGMAAVCNGLALHGLRPYCATFLVFHDYMRPSVRLSALMGLPVVYIYSHDSIYLGEDGPTHQPVEHLMALRMVPNLVTLRPADARETVEAWKVALARTEGPTAIVLTRQGVPSLPPEAPVESDFSQGGYRVLDPADPQVTLIGTGSEVSTAMEAAELLAADGIRAAVVSLPSWELLEQSNTEDSVFPAGVPRVSIEAGRTLGWQRWVGADGLSLGLDRFGASAPWKELQRSFGLTAEDLASAARSLLAD